jgi:hypothetical protein
MNLCGAVMSGVEMQFLDAAITNTVKSSPEIKETG